MYYGGHALGQMIQQGSGADMLSARIVGVVADTYQFGPEDPDSVQPILYLPLAQMPDDDLRVFRTSSRCVLPSSARPAGQLSRCRQAGRGRGGARATDQPRAKHGVHRARHHHRHANST